MGQNHSDEDLEDNDEDNEGNDEDNEDNDEDNEDADENNLRAARITLGFETNDFLELNQDEKTEQLKGVWDKGPTESVYIWISLMKFFVLFGANPLVLVEPNNLNLPDRELADANKFYEKALKYKKLENGETNFRGREVKADACKHMFAIAIDGGGIRGLVSALILRVVSNRVFGDEDIGHRVHWLAGTSTGSILALALAAREANNLARFTPTDCMSIYWQLKDIIFGQNNPVPLNTYIDKIKDVFKSLKYYISSKWTVETGLLVLKFFLPDLHERLRMREVRASNLARELEEIFRTETFELVDIFSQDNIHRPHVSVTAVNVSHRPAKLDIFENYKTIGRHMPHKTFFHEAARASSAAPTYFSHFKFETDAGTESNTQYIDGGFSANCPADVLLCEIDKHALTTGKRSEKITILSVGTGRQPDAPRIYAHAAEGMPKNIKGFVDLLISQVTGEDGKILECVEVQCKIRGIEFCRLNPKNFAFSDDVKDKGVELTECEPEVLINMLWCTLDYLHGAQAQIDKMGRHLFASFSVHRPRLMTV